MSLKSDSLTLYGVDFDLDYPLEAFPAPHGESIRNTLGLAFKDANLQVKEYLNLYREPISFQQFQKECSYLETILNKGFNKRELSNHSNHSNHSNQSNSSSQLNNSNSLKLSNNNEIKFEQQNNSLRDETILSEERRELLGTDFEQKSKENETTDFSQPINTQIVNNNSIGIHLDSKNISRDIFLLFCSWKRGWTIIDALEHGKICRDGWIYANLLIFYFLVTFIPNISTSFSDEFTWDEFIKTYFSLERILQSHIAWDSGYLDHVRGLGSFESMNNTSFDNSHSNLLSPQSLHNRESSNISSLTFGQNNFSPLTPITPSTPVSTRSKVSFLYSKPTSSTGRTSQSGLRPNVKNSLVIQNIEENSENASPTFAQWIFSKLKKKGSHGFFIPLSQWVDIFFGLCLFSSFLFECDSDKRGYITFDSFKNKFLQKVIPASREVHESISNELDAYIHTEAKDHITYFSLFQFLLYIELSKKPQPN